MIYAVNVVFGYIFVVVFFIENFAVNLNGSSSLDKFSSSMWEICDLQNSGQLR